MGQPIPPGDIPLIEGLGPEWNDIVSAIPEDQRSEIAPKFKERLSTYEPLKQWEDLHKSGITPEFAGTAVGLFNLIENDPRQVYEALGKHLNITPAQAKEVVQEIQDDKSGDPEIAALKQQIDTMAQVMLAQRQMTVQERQEQEQDAAIEKEITDLRKKYGNDFPEDEILMRMAYRDMTAEEAFHEYSGRVGEIQKRRPAPFVMGTGGSIPPKQIDVKKLDSASTKNLVSQMLEHSNAERNR